MLPLKANEQVPKVKVFTCGNISNDPGLRLYVSSFRSKIFLMKGGFLHDRHLYISIIKAQILIQYA